MPSPRREWDFGNDRTRNEDLLGIYQAMENAWFSSTPAIQQSYGLGTATDGVNICDWAAAYATTPLKTVAIRQTMTHNGIDCGI